jgi:alkylation response protein AidB-like acyl-CoA dehydrogenase
VWGLFAGLSIGLPPVMLFGNQYLQDKVSASVLQGKKCICLAITEPYAGSDVANLRTTARKTADGKHYIGASGLFSSIDVFASLAHDGSRAVADDAQSTARRSGSP